MTVDDTPALPSAAVTTLPHAAAAAAATGVDDPLGVPLRDVLALFADELADVRFPDVDDATLRAAAAAVADAHVEVRRLEGALHDARRALDEAHDALLLRAQRGVAYARVFADGDAALLARLDAIALPRGRGPRASSSGQASTPPTEPPRRRRRAPPAETLFSSPPDDADGDARAAQ
ncbi:MAG: hypothetical protein FJ137_18295 [Deltaproteobacteria bacterium]|nr:hypothetical protein [Deltaproteobacteria bacterium]